ncbi:MAG: discoidin domain-containing protein, partial [Coriobacteriia bacterium]|nr:discoidin domain-containing protein [Coriobacteriia bacterium]
RYESSTYAPAKAGDDNTGTFWWSDNTGDDSATERLWVDMGATYKISKVEIAWYGDLWAKEYKVQVSRDGKSWSDAYTTSSALKGTNTITFTERDARYVRIECKKTGTGNDNGYGIAELRVFGQSAVAPTTGTVSGTVTNASTLTAISGATVSVGGKTATTSGSGTYSVADLPAGTYTMTVSASGYDTKTTSVTITAGETFTANVALTLTPVAPVEEPVAPVGDLALGKSFYATESEGATYAPNFAGDDDSSTYWWSDDLGGASETAELWVDLGGEYEVGKAEIDWYGDLWASDYAIMVSTDGVSWTKVYETTVAEAGTNTVTFAPHNARYVKVSCRRTGTGVDNGYGIAAFVLSM